MRTTVDLLHDWPGFRCRQSAGLPILFDDELPKIDAWLAVVGSRNPVCRQMQDAWF